MLPRTILFCVLTLVAAPGAIAADRTMEELFEVAQRFANAGSKEGQFKLAEMYEEGRGTQVDLDKALEWYGKAARGGHAEALRRVENWESRQAARAEKRRQAELERQQAQQQAREKALAAQRAEEERRARIDAERRAREAREQEAAREAERQRREAQAQARREAERRAAAEKARREAQAAREAQRRATEKAQAAGTPNSAPEPARAPKPAGGADASESFEVDPCKTPAARFMSTCR